MSTSIMFCTYNRLKFTKRMLESFLKNTTSPYHLIIVDNGSIDKTREYLTETLQELGDDLGRFPYCLGAEVKFNEQNKGIAVGRNQGLLMAGKHNDDYLCTLDNDIELPERWLEDCIDILKSNPKFAV